MKNYKKLHPHYKNDPMSKWNDWIKAIFRQFLVYSAYNSFGMRKKSFFGLFSFPCFSSIFFSFLWDFLFCPNIFPVISNNLNDEWNETKQHNFFLIFMFKHKILRSFWRSLRHSAETRSTDSGVLIRLVKIQNSLKTVRLSALADLSRNDLYSQFRIRKAQWNLKDCGN